MVKLYKRSVSVLSLAMAAILSVFSATTGALAQYPKKKSARAATASAVSNKRIGVQAPQPASRAQGRAAVGRRGRAMAPQQTQAPPPLDPVPSPVAASQQSYEPPPSPPVGSNINPEKIAELEAKYSSLIAKMDKLEAEVADPGSKSLNKRLKALEKKHEKFSDDLKRIDAEVADTKSKIWSSY